MTDDDRARLRPLLEFYRRRVDAGLDLLERTRVTEGVLAVKFYSSSLVLKSAAGTVAVDFCQGPINNGGEPENRDNRRTGFYWTPQQRDRLAKLVDASLITHRHHDHADYSLSEPRILRSGHLAIDRLVRSSHLDFFSSPTLYSHRSLAAGGYSTFMSLTESYRLHNKLWWNENDLRTFRVLDVPAVTIEQVDRRQTPRETRDLLWREIGNVLAHGASQWYFDMGGGWYDDADLLALVRRQAEVAQTVLGRDRSSAAPCVSAAVLRALAKDAGVHVYLDEDAVVYANASVLSVTVVEPGRRRIRLPAAMAVADATSGRRITARADAFNCDFQERESRLFLLMW